MVLGGVVANLELGERSEVISPFLPFPYSHFPSPLFLYSPIPFPPPLPSLPSFLPYLPLEVGPTSS